MAGIKGKSGRKPRSDGKKMRPVNLYIPMTRMDVATINDRHAKIVNIPDEWFRQFKHVFGSRWQIETRKIMQIRLKEFERGHMWDCKCSSRLDKWHRSTDGGPCRKCGYEPYDMQRYKTQQQVNIHSRDEPSKKPLMLCPTCRNPLTLELDIHGRKVMICEACK